MTRTFLTTVFAMSALSAVVLFTVMDRDAQAQANVGTTGLEALQAITAPSMEG